MSDSRLLLQGLSFAYPAFDDSGPRRLFEGLEYSLANGQAGLILGNADAGKSTLSKIVCGLVPRFTGGDLRGTVRLGGGDIGAQKPFELTDKVALVFQNADEQILTTRCDTEIAFALESLGAEPQDIKRRVHESLSSLGLVDFAARNPATLSGGEKKRLLLACALAVDPPLWILDEAFEELDAAWKEAVLQRLHDSAKTVLFLDSRWSALYNGVVSSICVLEHGKLHRRQTTPLDGFSPLRAKRAASHAGEPVLRAQGVTFSFPGSAAFSLTVDDLVLERGSVCALVGANGSGKSTLGRILCGLLKPQTGVVAVMGKGAHTPLQSRVGYMFQNPDYQIFLPTVREELSFGLRGLGASEIHRRVAEALELFRLPDGETPPALMSYGSRKRLQAATYYLLDRDVMILDEVDSGLSYSDFMPVLDALRSKNSAIVLITHDAELAALVSDRTVVMEAGRITGGSGGESSRGA